MKNGGLKSLLSTSLKQRITKYAVASTFLLPTMAEHDTQPHTIFTITTDALTRRSTVQIPATTNPSQVSNIWLVWDMKSSAVEEREIVRDMSDNCAAYPSLELAWEHMLDCAEVNSGERIDRVAGDPSLLTWMKTH